MERIRRRKQKYPLITWLPEKKIHWRMKYILSSSLFPMYAKWNLPYRMSHQSCPPFFLSYKIGRLEKWVSMYEFYSKSAYYQGHFCLRLCPEIFLAIFGGTHGIFTRQNLPNLSWHESNWVRDEKQKNPFHFQKVTNSTACYEATLSISPSTYLYFIEFKPDLDENPFYNFSKKLRCKGRY